jgi:hypothetical protein
VFGDTTTTAGSVFGAKITTTSALPSGGNVFQESTKSILFGSKTQNTTKSATSLFGKPADVAKSEMESENNEDVMNKGPVVNLFKQMVQEGERDQRKGSEGRKKDGQPVKVLFGKPVSTAGTL